MTKAKTEVKKTAIHFTLQGKGGVGKSFISSIVAQYIKQKHGSVICIDTDPINQTFVNYRALEATQLHIMEDNKVNERMFDSLMERLLTEQGYFVVDNGASTFVPLSNYIIENNVMDMLSDNGSEIYIHCVITGGQALVDTLSGLKALATSTKGKKIIVWLNEFFGEIEADGKTFEQMRVYTENSEKILGVVRLEKRNQDTFGKDVQEMATQKLTFDEVLSGTNFNIMAKQRIKVVKADVFSQLDLLEI